MLSGYCVLLTTQRDCVYKLSVFNSAVIYILADSTMMVRSRLTGLVKSRLTGIKQARAKTKAFMSTGLQELQCVQKCVL